MAEVLARRPDGRLRPDDLAEVALDRTPFAKAVNRMVKGAATKLPKGYGFHDQNGHRRTHVRIAWWRPEARTWRDAARSVPNPAELPDAPLPARLDIDFYTADGPPVCVGHDKMQDPWAAHGNVVCLDGPDSPRAWRWAGDGLVVLPSAG